MSNGIRVPKPWNDSQRGVIIGLLVMLLGYLSFRLILNPVYVSNPQPAEPSRAAELQDRIDPNIADWQTLAALPLIGEKRAKDIVAYREQYVAQHQGENAFSKPSDLLEIRGIGTVTLAQLDPFLLFPARPSPATKP